MILELTKKFLTNKFARRFVIGLCVIIVIVKRYLQDNAQKVTCICLRLRSA
jgi:hypothetical protein